MSDLRLLINLENGSVRPTTQQRTSWETTITDHEMFERTRICIERHIVNLTDFVSELAKRPLTYKFKFAFGCGAFPII